MRTLIILALAVACISGADHVTVATKDGRSLTGYYDAEEGTITTTKPKATLRIKPEDIASITPVASPEQATVKNGGADIVGQLKARLSALTHDRDKARSAAQKNRMLAKDSRDPSSAKTLEENALSNDGEARGYQEMIDTLAARIAQLEKDTQATESPVAVKPRVSQVGQIRIELEKAQDKQADAERETQEIRTRLNRAIAEANREFILNGDLDPVGLTASARPTKEENDRAARVIALNLQLEQLRGFREELKRTATASVNKNNHGDHASANLFPGGASDHTERFWRAYAELKGKPAPY